MKSDNDQLTFSPSDLTSFIQCRHLTELQYEVALGQRKTPFVKNEYKELLARLGDEHEDAYLQSLRQSGLNIVEGIVRDPEGGLDWDASFAKTQQALTSGADIVFQAALTDGTWRGLADFLRKVDEPSSLGAYSYEVIDTKLARDVKVTAVLQVCAYSEMLNTLQGKLPEHAYLLLGDGRAIPVRLAECMAYFRRQRATFEAAVTARGDSAENVHYPEVVEHCDLCAWSRDCNKRRRDDDHLSLVAFLNRGQRSALSEAGISTLTALAESGLDVEVPDLRVESFRKHQTQARLQKKSYETGKLSYELLPPQTEPPNHGFSGLPEPTPHDLFFDIESDRWASEHGLEYLFGFVELQEGEPRYHALWAHDATAEKRVFEEFIDDLMARWHEHPGMHVYHYASYEKTALSRLAGRYETREEEVDSILRGGLLVDLYQIIRQSLQASVESYSIKRFEPFYMKERTDAISEGSNSVLAYEAWPKTPPEGRCPDGIREGLRHHLSRKRALPVRLQDSIDPLKRASGGVVPNRQARTARVPDSPLCAGRPVRPRQVDYMPRTFVVRSPALAAEACAPQAPLEARDRLL